MSQTIFNYRPSWLRQGLRALFFASSLSSLAVASTVYLPLDGVIDNEQAAGPSVEMLFQSAHHEPTFEADVPGQVILDGQSGGRINANNEKSLRLSRAAPRKGNGFVIENRMSPHALDVDAFTIEMFVKLEFPKELDSFSSLFARGGEDGRRESLSWAVSWPKGKNRLQFSFISLVQVENSGRKWLRMEDPITHGQWHHFAMTMAATSDGNTEVTLFLDYQPQARSVYAGQVDYSANLQNWVFGGYSIGAESTLMDEVRFTQRILKPSEFLVVEGKDLGLDNKSDGVTWSLDSLTEIVKPMRHDWRGRLPMLVWSLPDFPAGDLAVTLRESGELRRRIDLLAERGIVPPVRVHRIEAGATTAGAIAIARTLEEAGLPVHLLLHQKPVTEQTLWPEPEMWIKPYNDGKYGSDRAWPIFPMMTTEKSASLVKDVLLPLKEARVNVAAMWTDYEILPHPWNGGYGAQRRPDAGARQYYENPAVLEDLEMYKAYAYELRRKMLREVYQQPLQELYPNALYGNYGSFLSSQQSPYINCIGAVYPPMSIPERWTIMPPLYGVASRLGYYIKNEADLNQNNVDDVYGFAILRSFSTSSSNGVVDTLSFPYVSRYHTSTTKTVYQKWGLSSQRYQEVLRHVWLRGADGMFAFNLGETDGFGKATRTVTPQQSFESLEDQRVVMDEMLGFGRFLEAGKPMTFFVPTMHARGALWSGLALPGEVLVRVVTFGDQEELVSIPVFEGQEIDLKATPEGCYYLIKKGQQPRKVEPLKLEK